MNPASAPNSTLKAGSPLAAASLPARDLLEGKEIILGDSSAIEMHVPFNGQIIRAVLSDASFNKNRRYQESYAKELGARLAMRGENCAVAHDLLVKEQRLSLNKAEKKLLETYREKLVRDSDGGLNVQGDRVFIRTKISSRLTYHGALIVLPLTESLSAEEKLAQKLEAFIATYKIRAIEGEPSQVALTIPRDKKLTDFLREAQALSIALHADFRKKYTADSAIWPERLEQLLADPALQAKGTGLENITDGCVSGTNGEGMTREVATQKLAKQGLQHEQDPMLVAAHTARYILDATSIFQRHVVRAAGGAFYFNDIGLCVSGIRGDYSGDTVFSSARLAPESK